MDEMNELYYRDPYAAEFDADVVSCIRKEDHYEIVLSDTAFYPEGGGQAADHGTLNGIEIYDVQNRDGIIVHYAKKAVEGKRVHGKLDWNRRFANMQMHTADHIFSGVVHRHFGYDNVGFGISENCVRMDFNGMMSESDIRQMELEANQAIWNNLPVEESFPSPEELEHLEYRSKKELTGKVRIITIPGIDVCACCGTHVARTGEVGAIRIYSCEKYKNGVRVMMAAGRKALLEDNILADQNHQISVMLSAETAHTASAVRQLLDQQMELKKKIGDLNMKILQFKMQEYPENSTLAVDFEDGIDRNLMIRIANDLCDKRHIQTAAVLNKNDKGYAYVIISRTVNLKETAGELNRALHGQGGGKPESIQGNFQAVEEDIRDVLKQYLE